MDFEILNTNKEPAFTLAEVLITLGIIGVVAALTIPSLITNYKARKLHTQFLKSYSTTNLCKMMMFQWTPQHMTLEDITKHL